MCSKTFLTGSEFLEMLASMPSFCPDCVVLDVQMPGLDGLEVQRRLAGTGLPVIFITAHHDPVAQQCALAAGAVAVLRKPFNDGLLLEALNTAIAAHSAPSAG
jgi:FixJ family two-component response regulator